jgi:HIV Tat-specific factor 1
MKKLKKKRYLENKKRKWYQSKVNNYIYVQGLPSDITEAELKSYFVRCGVIRLDPYSGHEQIKLYVDKGTGIPKGDARIGYMMPESVDMAIEMLNETEIRPGVPITVQLAEFQQKGGDYVPRQK